MISTSKNGANIYTTSISYTSREDKMAYVYDKYKKILDNKSILDIGADKGYLREHLNASSHYMNMGFGTALSSIGILSIFPTPLRTKASIRCCALMFLSTWNISMRRLMNAYALRAIMSSPPSPMAIWTLILF